MPDSSALTQHIIRQANWLHYEHKHGGGFEECKHLFCRLANWIHTSRFSPYRDTCSLCGKLWSPSYHSLGYVWLCPKCQEMPGACPKCGSDVVLFSWQANAEDDSAPDISWLVECQYCGHGTSGPHETPAAALEEWRTHE